MVSFLFLLIHTIHADPAALRSSWRGPYCAVALDAVALDAVALAAVAVTALALAAVVVAAVDV